MNVSLERPDLVLKATIVTSVPSEWEKSFQNFFPKLKSGLPKHFFTLKMHWNPLWCEVVAFLHTAPKATTNSCAHVGNHCLCPKKEAQTNSIKLMSSPPSCRQWDLNNQCHQEGNEGLERRRSRGTAKKWQTGQKRKKLDPLHWNSSDPTGVGEGEGHDLFVRFNIKEKWANLLIRHKIYFQIDWACVPLIFSVEIDLCSFTRIVYD